jgi:hypothetical protein
MPKVESPSIAPPLLLRFKKTHDGATALCCTRADGSTTWQRTAAHNAPFFVRHDLTHYAVETVLGYAKGFYGLIASGWDFTDFGAPWPRGPIPPDADPAELIVGFFDAERAGNSPWSIAEFNDYAARFYGEGAASAPTLTQEQLTAIRAKLEELFEQWQAVKPGGALELAFPGNISSPTQQ